MMREVYKGVNQPWELQLVMDTVVMRVITPGTVIFALVIAILEIMNNHNAPMVVGHRPGRQAHPRYTEYVHWIRLSS